MVGLLTGAGVGSACAPDGWALAQARSGASMPIIRTVLGDVAPESLGARLFHEHLSMSNTFLEKQSGDCPSPIPQSRISRVI